MNPYIAIFNILLLSVLASTTCAKTTNSETDRLSLLAFKEKLTNGNPEALPSWNNSLHFCKWQGVSCTPRHMRVSALNLSNQNFDGTLSPALGNLTFLKLLDLSSNGLHGGIPTQFGRLNRLQYLDLTYNNLEGEVPVEIANCSKLQVISFKHNSLTGKVPFCFGSLLKLTWFSLAVNKFHGIIPPSLGNLSSLEHLSLAYNYNLEGSIPQTLGTLPYLTDLFLDFNNLSGLVPPSLYNLSQMEAIDLAYNQLFGTIPSNVDLAFPNLQLFHFGGNCFTGIIPPSLSNLSQLLEFDISENWFSGPIPTTLGSLKYIQRFIINVNNLGNRGGRDLDFLKSLTNCSQLQWVTMGENGFGGKLHNSIGNFSSELNIIDMEGNQISGTMPQEIGQLIGLTLLSVRDNFLQGPIPISIGKLKNLQKLYVGNNQLSGNIVVLENLTKLYRISLHHNDFEGSIPTNLKLCKGVQILSLNNNKLSGNIPNHTFSYLESLLTLDISHNYLTGALPSEFGDLKQLVQLDLSQNILSGDIPIEFGGCLQLTKLNMSGNFLEGSIPSSFASLKSLESLDLSRNNLSGNIPHELKDLRFLKTLNISYNHLLGEVPEGGVFNNITAISLTSNDDLCGGIPQLKLPACQNKAKKPLKAIIIPVIVISCVLISSIIFLTLYLRRRAKNLSSSTSSLQNKHLRVSYRELHDATNGFSSSNLIGTGSFGSVYRGTLNHFETFIAVKVLNLQTRGALKSFITECKTLSKIRHRNLLRILTVCSSVDYQGVDFKALVLEFMSNGSLDNWLSTNEHHESTNLNMDFRQRLDIAIDVAHALDYLHHDHEESIVHCDIKPSNILLDGDMVAHLADFGLAKIFHGLSYFNRDQTTSSAIKGTIGYFPPEYGAGRPISPQGDIYSYGIVLLEMLTGKKPTDNMFGEDLSLHKFCKLALAEGVIEIVDPNLLVPFNRNHMEVIQECLVSFVRIGVACSAKFPSERMGMKDVLRELLAIKRKLSSQGINLVIHN